MNRRSFLRRASSISILSAVSGALALAKNESLGGHRIAEMTVKRAKVPWPRNVGRNAVRGNHGRGPSPEICIFQTDQGAKGWGQVQGVKKTVEALRGEVIGKPVSDLIDPSVGILNANHFSIDIALHDLAGTILEQPVWQMMSGRREPFLTKVYSGMIYFDDLDPEESPAGIDKVLENCQWDYEYGYRQFKVKIGRGNKWMPAEEGLQRDIDVVKAIHESFPDVEILVDGNNGFTLETIVKFVEGIGDIPLFWIEEPFHETVNDWKALKEWLGKNGRSTTYCADGEARPDLPVLEALQKEGALDLRLDDICSHRFSNWRKSIVEFEKQGVGVSPHNWASALKMVYTAHLVGAYGNSPTIEGVTTVGGNVDFGGNRIQDAQLYLSTEPGFGMKLEA